jgi:hypothetical protein
MRNLPRKTMGKPLEKNLAQEKFIKNLKKTLFFKTEIKNFWNFF